jgi:hypothetical protein
MPGMVTGIAHHFWQEIVDDRLESTGAAVNYSDILQIWPQATARADADASGDVSQSHCGQ